MQLTVRAHPHLLSRLRFALRNPEFKAAVMQQASREQILQTLTRAEQAMGPGANSQGLPARTQPATD